MSSQTGDRDDPDARLATRIGLLAQLSRLEWAAAAVTAVVLAGLAIAEPDVLEAPFENARTMLFTFGGTAIAAIVLVVLLRLGVHPVARVLVLGIPFVAVSWWLLSPFFVDDVVNERFTTSIADPRPASPSNSGSQLPEGTPSTTAMPQPTPRGAGSFVGLAGHEGSGDARFFTLPDGSQVLRLERFDIDNGPDLRLYVVPGAEQTDPTDGSLYLGRLRGNVGDQTYQLPTDHPLGAGDWTVLVWCEAFDVEFVAATVTLT